MRGQLQPCRSLADSFLINSEPLVFRVGEVGVGGIRVKTILRFGAKLNPLVDFLNLSLANKPL